MIIMSKGFSNTPELTRIKKSMSLRKYYITHSIPKCGFKKGHKIRRITSSKGHNIGICQKCGKFHKISDRTLEARKAISLVCSLCKKNFECMNMSKKKYCSYKCQNKAHSERMEGEGNPIYKTRRPQYIKDAISKAHKGKKLSKETRKKMKGHIPWNKNKNHPKYEEYAKMVGDRTRGKTKEMDESIRRAGQNTSKTRLRLFKEGKLKSWCKGLTKNEHKGLKKCSEKMSARMQGIKLEDWKGYISFEPYGEDWNVYLKNQIRKRDNFTCQICGISEKKLSKKMDVHHINYNKKNHNFINLVSLCKRCHVKTNTKREYWEWQLNILNNIF